MGVKLLGHVRVLVGLRTRRTMINYFSLNADMLTEKNQIMSRPDFLLNVTYCTYIERVHFSMIGLLYRLS